MSKKQEKLFKVYFNTTYHFWKAASTDTTMHLIKAPNIEEADKFARDLLSYKFEKETKEEGSDVRAMTISDIQEVK